MQEEYYEYQSQDIDGLGFIYSFQSPCYDLRVLFDGYIYSDIVSRFEYLRNSLSFGVKSKKIESSPEIGPDNLIGATVQRIVGERFGPEKNPNQDAIVIYHCDWQDGKQAARNRKFNGWYSKSNLKESLTHISHPVKIEGTTHYIGIMYNTQNPSSEKIREEFSEAVSFIATYDYLKTRGHEQEEIISNG